MPNHGWGETYERISAIRPGRRCCSAAATAPTCCNRASRWGPGVQLIQNRIPPDGNLAPGPRLLHPPEAKWLESLTPSSVGELSPARSPSSSAFFHEHCCVARWFYSAVLDSACSGPPSRLPFYSWAETSHGLEQLDGFATTVTEAQTRAHADIMGGKPPGSATTS